MNPSRWAGPLLLALLAAALVACVIHTERVVVKPKLNDRTRVVYWEKWTGDEANAMRAVVDAFNESQDKYFVDFLSISQIETKALLATAGGIPPDVAGLFGPNLAQYASVNALRPVDDLIARDGIQGEDYIPVYWDMCEFEGSRYAMPSAPASTALFYNAQQWREAGLDPEKPPQTIEEFDAMVDKLSKVETGPNGKPKEVLQAGFLPSEPGWWRDRFGFIFGAELWDGESKITVNSPENIRAYEWVQSFSDRYGSQPANDFKASFGSFNSPQNAFMDGKVSSVLQGVWMPQFINKHKPDLDWRVAPFPHPADRPDLANMTYIDLDILVIPRGAKEVEGAWEFIKFVQSQRGMEMLCKGQGKHTPLREVSDDFWATNPNPSVRLFHELSFSPAAMAPPKLGMWKFYASQMQAAFDRINAGEDVTKVLNEVQNRLQPMLDQELKVRELRRSGSQ